METRNPLPRGSLCPDSGQKQESQEESGEVSGVPFACFPVIHRECLSPVCIGQMWVLGCG